MKNELHLKRTINAPREEVFRYFTNPKLLEKWSAPKDMTLKVPIFEAKTDGKYRYEHYDGNDVYVCNGHFEGFVPNEKLISVDTVASALRGTLFEDLHSEVTFIDEGPQTLVLVIQSGFKNSKDADDCREGWNQCFEKLDELIAHKRFRPGQEMREHQVRGD